MRNEDFNNFDDKPSHSNRFLILSSQSNAVSHEGDVLTRCTYGSVHLEEEATDLSILIRAEEGTKAG